MRRERPARHEREQEIVAATRALFDERGSLDAPVDEVARRVGINRALVYRHFASREELWVRTIVTYVDELAGELRAARGAWEDDPVAAQRRMSTAFADFGLARPAFAECALALMRRPAGELRELVGDGTWVHLGRAMGACLAVEAEVLGCGAFPAVRDPDLAANALYAQGLGLLHLARIGVGVRELAPGTGVAFGIDADDVREALVASALGFLGVTGAAR
jgi:AcrR family transcriptional regulator